MIRGFGRFRLGPGAARASGLRKGGAGFFETWRASGAFLPSFTPWPNAAYSPSKAFSYGIWFFQQKGVVWYC